MTLLCGEKLPEPLHLILKDLQLIDPFLLGKFQAVGFLHQLLGGFRSLRLLLAKGYQPVLLLGGLDRRSTP